MRHITFIFITVLFLGQAKAQESADTIMQFDLPGAVNYALEHNKELMSARQELVRTERSIWEAISQGLPKADFLVDYMTYFNYELEFALGGDEDFEFSDEQINTAMTNTLSQPQFSTLTPQDLNIHFAGSYFDSELQSMMPPSTILMSDQLTAKLQVSQLVFSGQYFVGIQTAKLGKIISKQALDNSEIGTKESVINAYYLILISEKSLDYIEKNLENIRKTYQQTQRMVDAGMAEQLDADQFKVTVNQLENTKRSMKRNLELNYNMLRFTMGLPAGTKIELNDTLEDLFKEMEAIDLLMQDFDVNQNITYQILNSQAEINKKLWNMEKWNYGPNLAAYYNYNFKILTTGFDMTPNHLLGFSLTVPIFSSGLRDAKADQARITYEISKRDAEILSDQLELQNRQLKYNLQNSLENFHTQQENVEVAQSLYENYQRKYDHGMASSLDVTQSNSNYLDAQSNYLNAMFEVMDARIQLDKLMNNLNDLTGEN
ncbi:MAG TPA: TolC family protein [Bacteroidales bacterium]|nr:TolC family protein [Bacteroidales bacterium]